MRIFNAVGVASTNETYIAGRQWEIKIISQKEEI